jgi:hypothetical protein
MPEENKSTEWNDESTERSLSKMASSFYKAQLGINSIRDELRIQNDLLKSIAESLEKK